MNTHQITKVDHINRIQQAMGHGQREDTRKAIGRVMHVLRDMLPEKDAYTLTYTLPSDLLIIYLSAWPYKGANEDIKHLDEMVRKVKEKDALKTNSILLTEIDALQCTLLVLETLEKEVGILSLLPTSIQLEVRHALIHSAA
ncbi:DUF2267 domain-containing protein [Fulvivirga sp. M361]|uniref:DUF2267 domain-containing protein n=1 Tax=Fulvivirga sp. M361 TaxID=2594266 RepID=UPI001179BEF9|nr:DUF2267 domain-containing protein [Fulvivirga sp. M361]TRX60512.1 DUF2267 domain-containing protein [Fulvivirga sp. M361]